MQKRKQEAYDKLELTRVDEAKVQIEHTRKQVTKARFASKEVEYVRHLQPKDIIWKMASREEKYARQNQVNNLAVKYWKMDHNHSHKQSVI